jgi:fatty-acyl-CoA synthase
MFDADAISSIADIPREMARQSGNRAALDYAGRTTTYAEFERYTAQIANGLLGLEVRQGERIGYLGKNSDRFYELLFGAARMGGVLAPINWRLALPEMMHILEDAGTQILFVAPPLYARAQELARACPSLRTVVALEEAETGFVSYEAWRQQQSTRASSFCPDGNDTVVQLYTSGTTGLPKGVELTHDNLTTQLRLAGMIGMANYAPGEVTLIAMPVFHIAGVAMGVFSLAQGARGHVLAEADAERILSLISEKAINYAFIVPAVIQAMLLSPRAERTDFSSLKLITYGASPISDSVLSRAQAVFGCDFLQLYGLTETTGGVCWLPPQDHVAGSARLRACGIAYPETEVRVVDALGRSLGPKEVGEVVIRSDLVMKGYWNKPEATQAAIRDGWFHSGDAGYFDADGYLYIYDRVKDMIVSGAENVYPAEVENALFSHPAVADVAVIGVPDDKWGEAVKAVVVVKPGMTLCAEELSQHARTRIAGYKVPKSYDFVAALPRNASGKVLKRELRAPFWEGRGRQIA